MNRITAQGFFNRATLPGASGRLKHVATGAAQFEAVFAFSSGGECPHRPHSGHARGNQISRAPLDARPYYGSLEVCQDRIELGGIRLVALK